MSEQRLIDANKIFDEYFYEMHGNFSDDYAKGFQAGLYVIRKQSVIDPETLPIAQELREKLMLTEANQNHFKEERDLFLFKTKETAEAATSEIDRRNKTICELRAELEQVTAERDAARRDCAVAERNHSECLAQLAKARAQLKFAVADMEALMWHSGDGCNICKHCVEVHREPYVRLDCDLGGGCECKPEWRGQDGDHT